METTVWAGIRILHLEALGMRMAWYSSAALCSTLIRRRVVLVMSFRVQARSEELIKLAG